MNAKLEKLENSMVKLTIEVDAEAFEEGLKVAYNKNKKKITLPGFRKGRAPRQLIEKTYGAEVFYEDAANYIIPDAYDKAVEEKELKVVSRPEVNVEKIEKGQPFIFTAEVAVKPEVTLGDYTGLEVNKIDIVVEEQEVSAEIDKVREQNSRLEIVTDRPIEDKDMVIIDFDGYIDGESFEGGKSTDYSLTIGSHTFIDTFEEQLIGKSMDEDVEVDVTFPDDYKQEDLQGKPALFKVKIKEIKVKELPELDDEFAKDVSDCETLEEYKIEVMDKLKEQKEKEAVNQKREAVTKKAVENATMNIPDPMIDLQAENMAYDFARNLQYQGLPIEQYFQYTGQNMDSLKENMKEQATQSIQSRLVLEAIAKAEDMQVTEMELEEELKSMAKSYNMAYEELVKTVKDNEKESIKEDLMIKKALEFIEQNAKEV